MGIPFVYSFILLQVIFIGICYLLMEEPITYDKKDTKKDGDGKNTPI